VGFRAAYVLELDGGVAYVVVVLEQVVEVEQDAGALGGGNVGDGDVAGEGAGLGAEVPYMEIVDIKDAFDGFHSGADYWERNAAWSAFKKDVERLANDADAGPEDERGDEQREDGVDPVLAGEKDGCASGDNGGGGEGVAGHVQEGGAHVDVAGHAPKQSGDDAVHQDSGGRHDHHEARLDDDGDRETVEGFDRDPDGDDDECGCVDEGGKHAGALIAEGLGMAGGAGLEIHCGEAQAKGEEVGDIVAGFGEQGQGVGAEAGDECDDDIGERGQQREA